MKKSLIALAALAAIGTVSAQTTDGKPGFQITGNLNAGYVANNYGGNKVSGFEQNGMGTSQLMFRGLEDLGGGLKAYFLHDTDIQFMTGSGDNGTMPAAGNNNTGRAGTFGNDQKYVGLSGGFGNVAFGTINNASLYNGIILLNPTVGTSYASGFGSTVCADPTCSIVRYDNTIEYKSPVMSGLQLFGQYAAKQSKAANTNSSITLGALNMPQMTEISAKYSNGPLAAAYTRLDTDATGIATVAAASQVKNSLDIFAAAYDLGNGLRLAGLYQKRLQNSTDAAAKKDLQTTQASAIYTMGVNMFILNVGQTKENNAARTTFGGKTSKFTGVGYKYALSKMTTLEAKYENLDDQAGTQAFPGQFATTNRTRTRSTLGMNMNF